MSNLVRASEDQSEPSVGGVESRKIHGLSVEEILGNIFVFNFAGHDTTAISLEYSMLLLVSHPEVQDWISEEMNLLIEERNSKPLDYDTLFPKLKRTLAVLVWRGSPFLIQKATD